MLTLFPSRMGWLVFCVAVCCFVAAAYACLNGCTPVERQDVAKVADVVDVPLHDVCSVVQTAENAEVDFVCLSLEAADKLLEKMPALRKTSTTGPLGPVQNLDGGTTTPAIVHLRLYLPDAGRVG